MASIYCQGDEEPVEGVPVEVVGICCCDMPEGDVPECHVTVVIMGYCASEDAEDAYKGFGDGDPIGETRPEVAVRCRQFWVFWGVGDGDDGNFGGRICGGLFGDW